MGDEGDLYRTMQNGNLTICGLDAGGEGIRIAGESYALSKFAEVRAHLRRRGQLISDFDILLGATALHYGLIVPTYNQKHCQRIPDLNISQPKRL